MYRKKFIDISNKTEKQIEGIVWEQRTVAGDDKRASIAHNEETKKI